MTTTFTHCFPQINEADIKLFEAKLRIELPESYRAFLLAHNGGEPTPNIFLISEYEGNDSLRLLFGISPGEEYDLETYIKDYLGRIPTNFLPIGYDDLGNLVCLSINGHDIGKVYFWDHDREIVEGLPDYSNVTLMANSFSEFIDSLYELLD